MKRDPAGTSARRTCTSSTVSRAFFGPRRRLPPARGLASVAFSIPDGLDGFNAGGPFSPFSRRISSRSAATSARSAAFSSRSCNSKLLRPAASKLSISGTRLVMIA